MFEEDIDVYVHKNIIMDIIELAEIYGFGYKLLQFTSYMYNICIEYEAKFEKQITEFIDDVNTVKQTTIFNTQQNYEQIFD
jgi:hypothetical protein